MIFPDGKKLLIQSDYDQVGFAIDCGLIKPLANFDGNPITLGEDWENCDLEDIEQCPLEYYGMAE